MGQYNKNSRSKALCLEVQQKDLSLDDQKDAEAAHVYEVLISEEDKK